MVDEREEGFDEQEEGEYHFSEDQISYDMEPETAPKIATIPSSPGKNLIDKLSQNRRMIFGVLLTVGLVFVVYKVMIPATPSQPTDFAQNAAPTVTAQAKPAAPAPAAPATPQALAQAQQVAAPPPAQPVMPQAVPTEVPSGPAAQPAPLASATPTPDATVPAPITPTDVAMQQPASTPPAAPESSPLGSMSAQIQNQVASQAQLVMPPQAAAAIQSYQQPSNDRLAALEQQNAKLMTFLQNDGQKFSAYEEQSSDIQNKIQDLNNRLATMEKTLGRLTQVLHAISQHQASAAPASAPASAESQEASYPPATKVVPKTAYTVQAIIPGRAWLKSDSGDTVTVAEGDSLREYGRIAKIDPYDGVVQIDTGNKMLTLSYGGNGE